MDNKGMIELALRFLHEETSLNVLESELGDWVPPSIAKRYAYYYTKMYKEWKFSHDEISVLLEQRDGVSQWTYPALYPNGSPMEPDYFTEVVSFIAQIQWATQMSPENGIYELGGEFARRGYMQANNLTGTGRKVDRLTILLRECVRKQTSLNPDGKYTWRDILYILHKYDCPSDPILEQIDDVNEEIEWINIKGEAKTTGFREFQNRVTEAKKYINS
jgi:hypothetical protein